MKTLNEIYFAPNWAEIRGKAHLYKTAQLKSTGEYVGIVGVRSWLDGNKLAEPCFAIRVSGYAGIEHRTTNELCNFTL